MVTIQEVPLWPPVVYRRIETKPHHLQDGFTALIIICSQQQGRRKQSADGQAQLDVGGEVTITLFS